MHILLDTHILIWQLEGDSQLSTDDRLLIADTRNTTYISTVTFWEIAIKQSLGKLKLSKSLEDVIRSVKLSSSVILTVEPEHTVQVAKLPHLHKDPFDRMLVSQAFVESLSL